MPQAQTNDTALLAPRTRTAQPTPAPWWFEPTYQGALTDKFKGFPFSINGANGFQPCLIYGDGTDNAGTAEANARLIATAPELLEACESILRRWHMGEPTDSEHIEFIRSTIAKATTL